MYPQKLQIISRAGGIREKLKYERFFDQLYWLKVTNLLNKMPTCFKVGILCIFNLGDIFKYLILILICKCTSYKRYCVKWLLD
ncbi:hypothetical protein DCO44_06250 [Acinetobacter sp. AM]|nr:hypothetical protein DCO44_06250 [Acinetobacter sp. AM]